MYPSLSINIERLKKNLDAVASITEQGGCSLMIVTKGLCADPGLVEMVTGHPMVKYVADSRVKNLASYADAARAAGKKTLLLRLPQHCEISQVVEFADVSFNSEISTLRLLNEEAAKQGRQHSVVLMVDLGDLREGIFYKEEEEIIETARLIEDMKSLKLEGIAVNLTCYGAIIPKYDNLHKLEEIAEKIENALDIKVEMISGGNSSSIYLIGRGELPKRINNLRLGEAFLLGNDTAYGRKIEGTTDEALILKAQIIELKEKPSLPIGEVGKDAFGNVPEYEDRGIIKRAIVAIGKQDTDLDSMQALDPKVDILGGSSDHTILDVTKSERNYKVGDIVEFKPGYGAMLKAATSTYVEKEYL